MNTRLKAFIQTCLPVELGETIWPPLKPGQVYAYPINKQGAYTPMDPKAIIGTRTTFPHQGGDPVTVPLMRSDFIFSSPLPRGPGSPYDEAVRSVGPLPATRAFV